MDDGKMKKIALFDEIVMTLSFIVFLATLYIQFFQGTIYNQYPWIGKVMLISFVVLLVFSIGTLLFVFIGLIKNHKNHKKAKANKKTKKTKHVYEDYYNSNDGIRQNEPSSEQNDQQQNIFNQPMQPQLTQNVVSGIHNPKIKMNIDKDKYVFIVKILNDVKFWNWEVKLIEKVF